MHRPMALLFALGLQSFGNAWSEDWAQWNGPTRTGKIRESGWIDTIPSQGIQPLWRASIAGGYSGPAVAGDLVYVSDFVKQSGSSTNNPGARDQLQGKERIHCFDAKSGKGVWSYGYDVHYSLSYASGPRVTPLVDDSLVYFLGAEGDLAALEAKTGALRWKKNFKEEYKTESPIWGYAASPLILGEQLICLAGGSGSVVVSLDKKTGKENWRSLTASEMGYCPPTLVQWNGIDQLLIWDADNLHSLHPQTGKEYWSQPLKPSYGMSIAAPVHSGNKLYASGIGEVGALFELQVDAAKKPTSKLLWKGTPKSALYCANSTPVIDGDYLYGCDCGKGTLVCARLSDGERQWETFEPTAGGTRRASHGTAFLNRVDDRYFILSETGDLIIAKLTPEKYMEIGRQKVIEPTNDCFGRAVVWSYPAYSNRCLYVRNDKEIVCYSLAK